MQIPKWPDRDNTDFQHYVGRLLLKLQQMAAQQEHAEDRELIEHVALHLEGKLYANEFVILAWAAFWQPIMQSLFPSTDLEVMRAEQEPEESDIELPDSLKEPPTHLLDGMVEEVETISHPRFFNLSNAFDKCAKCGTLVAPGCAHTCEKTVDLPSGQQVKIKPFLPAKHVRFNYNEPPVQSCASDVQIPYVCDKCKDTGKLSVANRLVEQSGFDPDEYQAKARMGATEPCDCETGKFIQERRDEQAKKVNQQRLMEVFKHEMRNACKQFIWQKMGIDLPIIQSAVDRALGLMREKFGPLPFTIEIEQHEDDPDNAKLVFKTDDLYWAYILKELLYG